MFQDRVVPGPNRWYAVVPGPNRGYAVVPGPNLRDPIVAYPFVCISHPHDFGSELGRSTLNQSFPLNFPLPSSATFPSHQPFCDCPYHVHSLPNRIPLHSPTHTFPLLHFRLSFLYILVLAKGVLVCVYRICNFPDIFVDDIVIVIVIVNSKLLKRHSKAKRRAPAYSRALRQIRRVFQ